MTIKTFAAIFCAAAFAMSTAAVVPAEAQGTSQTKKSAAKKTGAKKYGPVPISMAPPRARITVTRRTYLDAGTYVTPGDRKFTDYAIPPGYSPTSVIDNRGGVYIDQSPLPGPFTLPGRDNPYPWNWCVGC
ncbi:MAG TPA: hypothetical protein VFB68_11935 [Xanthobacteraceae bacterium]|nr:hypothetical protein [Xanthobacteraceae bacterium]